MRFAGVLLAIASGVFAQLPYPDGGSVRPGALPDRWPTGGPRCAESPEFFIHEYNPDLYIFRQSACSNYEKPFLYLIFGRDRALLIDTGAASAPVARTMDSLIQKWLKRNNRPAIHLVVAHSHEHGDHTAGDAQFESWPQSELVAPTLAAVQSHFGIRDWPNQIATYDLGGGRIVDIVPLPGHALTSVAYYDRQTGILFTGDSLYPGRLYVRDWEAFARSTKRLVAFTTGKPVTHILGCHIENSATPFLDYPVGSLIQPDEHRLELGRAHLLELDHTLDALAGKPRRVALRDFTIWPMIDAADREEMSKLGARVNAAQQRRLWDQAAPSNAPFVPKEFVVPTTFASNGYILRQLGPGLEKHDYDAYMSSIEHIRTSFGGGRWPTPGITMKEALADVEGEKQRFDARQSFTYAVLTPDGQRERGCVYISPSRDARFDAQVRIWVTKADFDSGLEAQLWTEMRRWVNMQWPFERVRFAEPLR